MDMTSGSGGTFHPAGIPERPHLHTRPHAQRNEYDDENGEQPEFEGVVQYVDDIGDVPDHQPLDEVDGGKTVGHLGDHRCHTVADGRLLDPGHQEEQQRQLDHHP